MPSIQPEDTALWLNLLHEGYEAKGIQQVLAKYRIVTNSVSRNKIRALFGIGIVKGTRTTEFGANFYYFSKYAYHAYKKIKSM